MKVEILGTGPEIIKNGTRGIEPVIEETINQAKNEIQIATYVFTSRALHIIELLQQAAERGVRISIIINSFTCRDKIVTNKLEDLSANFPHVRIFNFKSKRKQLHAKVVIADRNIAVIGSANLSWGGMYSNYEIGLLLEGEPVWELGKIIDQLSLIT